MMLKLICRRDDWRNRCIAEDAKFCVEHGVVSDVEVLAITETNEAYERMIAGDGR